MSMLLPAFVKRRYNLIKGKAMNKSYRSIWNDALGAWVAVSEIETAKGKPVGSSVGGVPASAWRTGLRAVVLVLGMAFAGISQAYAASGTLNCRWEGPTAASDGQPGGYSHNITCGKNTRASADESIAIGMLTTANGRQAVALGANAAAEGASSVAIGGDDLTVMPQELKAKYQQLTGNPLVDESNKYPKTQTGDGGTAVGISARAGKLATAFGARAHAQGDVALALGVGSHADKENAVAIGAGSTTAGDATAPRSVEINGVTFSFNGGNNLKSGDQVSFGTAGFERQLRNVAPGVVSETSTDGINGSQLYAVAKKLTDVDRNVTNLQGEQIHFYSVSTSGVASPETKGNYNNDGATAAKAIAAGVDASATAEDAIAVGTGARATTSAGTVAVGKGAAATGTAAVAVGVTSSASGGSAVAVGNNSNTRQDNGVAVGNKASARGAGGVSIGTNAGNNEASVTGTVGNNTVFVGTGAGQNAIGNEGHIAVGWDAGKGSNGTFNVAMGFQAGQNTVGEGNVAIGKGAGNGAAARTVHTVTIGTAAQAVSDATVAIGNQSKAEGGSSIALGDRAKSVNSQTVAIGQEAQALSAWDISIGRRAGKDITAPHSNGRNISIGDGALQGAASPENNTAIGTNASAKSIGGYNVTIGTYANSSTALAGTGVADTEKVTASNVVAIGDRAVANTTNAVGIGSKAKALNNAAVAVGAGAEARGLYSIAEGFYAKAGGTSSIAIGSAQQVAKNTQATGNFAIAVGAVETLATGVSSVAVGHTTKAAGASAVAIGQNAQAQGASSVAAGKGAQVTAVGGSGVAVGQNAQTDSTKGIAIGDGAQAIGAKTANIAIGDAANTNSSAAIVIGTRAKTEASVDSSSAIAIGFEAVANQKDTTAIGYKASATGASSVALGSTAQTTKAQAVAAGYKTNANGYQSVALGASAFTGENAGSSVAVGREARAELANGVALGSGSVANVRHGAVGADPLAAAADKNNSTWTATTAAVAVGNVNHVTQEGVASPITRQITGVAAGTQDTDAVNVAQLKAAGIQVATSASEGEAAAATPEKVQNGQTFTLDAGKNIKLAQTGGKVSIATKDDVVFESVAVGDVRIDNAGINAGNKVIAGVAVPTADNHAANKAYVDGGRTQVKSANQSVKIAETLENGAKVFDLSVDTSDLAKADGSNLNLLYGGDNGSTGTNAANTRVQFNGKAGEIVTEAADGSVTFKLADEVKNQIEANKNQAETNKNQIADNQAIAKGNMAALGGTYDAATDTYTAPSYTLKNTEGAGKPAVHTVQEALSSLNEEIEKPLTFMADKGTDSIRKLGSAVSIKAGNFSGAASAENLVTENDGNGTITIKLADNPVFKGKVSAQGLDAGGQQITGVAQGTQGTDAVNVDQLQQALKDITVENQALVEADSPFAYVNAAGDQLIRKVDGQGQPYFVKAADGTTRYEGNDIVVSALSPTNLQTTVATRVTNVAKGVQDTDAVNTAQLKDVLTALGTTLGADGTPVQPTYAITRADGSPVATVSNVGEALGHLNTVLKDPITVSGNTNNGTSTIVQGGSDQKLGSKLAIEGGLIDGTSSAANIRTVVTDGKVEIQLADAPTFTGKVSANGFDAGNAKMTGVANGSAPTDAVNVSQLSPLAQALGVSVDETGGTVAAPSFTVAKSDGSSYEAVNTVQGALDNIGSEIQKPVTFAGDNGSFDRKLGSTVNVKGGADEAKLSDRNIGVVSNGTDTLDIKLSKELAGLTNAQFADDQGNNTTVNGSGVTVRDAAGQNTAALNSDGLAIQNGPSLTKNGLDAANTAIRNVASGAVGENSTDAVNGSQLHAQGKGVEKLVGGTTVYNPADGSFANTNIGGTGKNNIHEAIESVRNTAGAGWNLTAEGESSSNVAAGDTVDLASNDKNIVISKEADSDKVVFDLADDITANSVTAGDTVLDKAGVRVGGNTALTSDGLNISAPGKAPVVLNSDGLNNGGNVIANVGAGKNLTDAVNVSQLTPLATALGAAFDPASGNVSTPVFTVARTDGSTYPAVNSIQGAFDHIGTEIRKPVSFEGNTGSVERKLGETLVVKGSLGDSAQASDQNIRTKVENGTMTIELAESPKFGKVTINNGGKITGIEAGEVVDGGKDAVNGHQLHAHGEGVKALVGGNTAYNPETGTYTNNDIGGTGAANIHDAIAAVKNTANTGWNLTAQGKNGSNVQPGETVDLRNTDGNIVVGKTDEEDRVTFDLAKTVKVEAVQTGVTTVNNDGVAVADNVALTSDGLQVSNPASGKKVSLTSTGLNNGGNVITGLANGSVTEGSQEAVTGDQLFAVDKKVADNTTALERGLDFAGNSGNFNRRLGERTTIKGGLDNAAAASDTNIRTVADSTGNIQIMLADAPVFKGKLTAQGLDAGGQKITNVKDGEEAGDAVNISQLQRALDNQTITHQSLVQANSPFSYVNSKGEVLARQVDSSGKEHFIKVADGSEYTEKDITISSLNPLDPQTAVPTVVGNIADGKKNNDAVNVGQLKNVVKALGGGAEVSADGSIKDPVYTITRNNGGRETVNTVGDALNLLNAEINKPLTFAGDNQDVKVVRSLDTELKVKGGANGTLTENNIGVTGSTDDNSLLIRLAENVNLGENGSLTAGKTVVNDNGVAVGTNVALTSDGLKAGDVNITYAGIDAGGKKITGVKAGEQATDAVNKAQLDAVKAAASNKVAAQGNLTVKEEANDDGSTTYTLATADDVNFNSVTSGQGANQVVLDGKGVTVGGNTYLTAQGINANGRKVSNVGKGSITADSTDAVNGSQLHRTAASVANLLGGDADVNSDGGISMTNIGGTGADNINDAIKAVNRTVAANKADVVQGDNIVVDKTTNPDGSAVYKVATAKDLKVDSVSAGGNTTLNADGISIANGPSMTANGIDAAAKKLTNVADGEISATSKDAVNGSQLYQAYQVLGGNNTSINMKDAPANTNNEGNTTPAGTVTTVVTNPDGTKTTTVETNQKVAVSTDKGGKQYTLTTYNVEGQNTYVTNDVIQAIGKMNEQGIKFFHTNDGEVKAVAQGSNTEDSSASGAYATAIGYQTSASGQGAVALGNTYTVVDKDGNKAQGSDGKVKQQRTQASGKNAVAIGTGSQANNENTIAIGTGNIVNGKNAGAIGDPSVINGDNTYSVGNNNTVNSSNTFVLGNSVTETINNSVVLGNEAAAKAVHTTAAGGHYTYAGANDANVAGVNDVAGVVSVGKEGQTRQIQNVAAGVVSPTSTDAINGSQLYHTNEAINQVGNQVVNVGNYLNQRIEDVQAQSNAGTAAAMAVAGLPQAYLPGKSMMAVSGSTYRGESGYAVGFSSISDNGNWVIKGTATGNSRGHYGATAGVGYQW